MRRTSFAFALTLGLWIATRPALASDIPLLVFGDVNGSAKTDLVQTLAGPDRPLSGVTVEIRDGETREYVVTGPEGRTTAIGPASGVVLLTPRVPGDPSCTSHNTARRLPTVIDTGDPIVYVALGDSTPVVGSDTPYPARLATLLESLGSVQVTNLARPGSLTEDWVPGARLFEQSKAAVATADLVTLSLGGNDLEDAAFSGDPFTIFQVAEQAIQNLILVTDGLRALNPDMDLVVTVYANYAMGDLWADWVPADYLDLVRSGMGTILEQMRDALVERDDVLIGDCYEALLGQDVNPYMFDEIHLNDAGHALYARVILRSLGAALLPDDDGRDRSFAFLAEPLAPDTVGDGMSEDLPIPEDSGPDNGAGPDSVIEDPGMAVDAVADAGSGSDEGHPADPGTADPDNAEGDDTAPDTAGNLDGSSDRDPGSAGDSQPTDAAGSTDGTPAPDIQTAAGARSGGCSAGAGHNVGSGAETSFLLFLVLLALLWAATRRPALTGPMPPSRSGSPLL